ncbi:LysR family transcriptional regulator [Stenotrophomonas maltophilia]|uniref:LysR family transcriptional regulator n=1 Tax=Stenotrophomonas maltophilia TaxID=40324 RepID=UPI002895A762|nr:LysR family transcriptional regulator [Stenotrophomonas maltophilia]MDT3431474.1 LysR family transcriptional regulator [Stenotrophomonas maltophilia]
MARLYNGALIAPGTGMDSFNLMRAFRRIVERGGLARAAEDLGMSPAGLSKQLRTLEAHLGVVLLQRTTRRMSLTETGHAYYRECCRLLDELDALERGIAEQRGEVTGRLRVNAPQSFALSTLSPLLPRFLQQHPQLSLDLVMEDRLLDAVGEGFDVSLRLRAELDDSRLVARRLASLQQVLCAAPSYLRQHPAPQAVDDLQAHSVLAYSLSDSPGSWPLLGPDGQVTITLPARVTVNNSLLLRDLLVAGMGIGALPSFLAAPALARGELQQVLPDHRYPPRFVHAVYPTSRHLQPKVRAFIDFLHTELPGCAGLDS